MTGAPPEPGSCILEGAGGGWRRPRAFRDPLAVFRSKDGRGALEWNDGKTEPTDGDPFLRLSTLLGDYPDLTAAGFWGYDLRYHLERLPRLAADDLRLPDCWVGLYRIADCSDCGLRTAPIADCGLRIAD